MFQSPNDGVEEYLIPLGYAMVYNHSSNPNAEWDIDEEDNRFVRFFAVEEIKQGEEILHDYGTAYWESR
jgi:SET domain-containing protein